MDDGGNPVDGREPILTLENIVEETTQAHRQIKEEGVFSAAEATAIVKLSREMLKFKPEELRAQESCGFGQCPPPLPLFKQ